MDGCLRRPSSFLPPLRAPQRPPRRRAGMGGGRGEKGERHASRAACREPRRSPAPSPLPPAWPGKGPRPQAQGIFSGAGPWQAGACHCARGHVPPLRPPARALPHRAPFAPWSASPPRRGAGGSQHGGEPLVGRMPSSEWIGRRWFEMRVGYVTYLAFTFGLGNFVLILHGLTDWFRDYPLHWIAVALVAVIVPVSILVGHRHNRTQQKTEARNLTHLHPYNNLLTPDSKEELAVRILYTQAAWMIETAKRSGDDELAARLERIGRATRRLLDGETATEALRKEGV